MEKYIFINGEKTDYSCNDSGCVFSNKRKNKIELKYNTHKDGYQMCYLSHNGIRYSILRHRIIATCFVNNPLNKPQVNHKDGVKSNCNANNLEWTTQSENIKHAYNNKLMKKTFKDCYNALLCEEQVKEIRIMIKNKIKQRVIAKTFNVGEQIISRIKHNKGYIGVGLIEKGEAIDVNTLTESPYK